MLFVGTVERLCYLFVQSKDYAIFWYNRWNLLFICTVVGFCNLLVE